MGNPITDFLGGLIGSNTGNIIAGFGGAAAQNKAIKDIRGLSKDATTAIYGPDYTVPEGGLLGMVKAESQFKPFGVTTPTGARASFSSTGNLDTSLSPTEQALQEKLLGFGTRAFGFLDDPAAREAEQGEMIRLLTQDPSQRGAREQAIMDNLTDLQAPEQERQRLALEERLLGQGRTGVRTSMFGGTPEQLALEKAIQEQQAGSALTAMEQARAEQALTSQQTLQGLGETRARLGLLGELGLQSLPAAYQGQNQLLANLAPALEEARIRAALQSSAVGIGAGLAESGLEARLGFEGLAASLRQQQFQGLFDLLKGEQQSSSSNSGQGATITVNPQTGEFGVGGALGGINDVLANAKSIFG